MHIHGDVIIAPIMSCIIKELDAHVYENLVLLGVLRDNESLSSVPMDIDA